MRSLYGPTLRSPEPSPPETDDPMLTDPQGLNAAGRRLWVQSVERYALEDLACQLMADNDKLRRRG